MIKIKHIGRGFLFLVGVTFLTYGYLFYENNRTVGKVDKFQIQQSYEKSVAWLLENKQKTLQDRNPILWWMIRQSAENANDDRLRSLVTEFLATSTMEESHSAWNVFIEPEKYFGENFPPYAYQGYSSYQQYFLFGITCSKSFADDPIIIRQHDVDYCENNDQTLACITHQLMAYRFMQRYRCDRVDGLADRVRGLQEKIYDKLVWDPRVIDVYLQRVLMLVDSGAVNKVKPVWVKRILDAQLPDGSWAWKQRLIYLGFGKHLSFGDTYYVPYPATAGGTLHTTAQGIWLMSLLRQEENYTVLTAKSI